MFNFFKNLFKKISDPDDFCLGEFIIMPKFSDAPEQDKEINKLETSDLTTDEFY